ncbi:MAG: hypothetical protein RLN63_03715, partial [Miltoncostaeaceae bacterium]
MTPPPPADERRRARRRRLIGAVTAAIVALILAGAWAVMGPGGSGDGPESSPERVDAGTTDTGPGATTRPRARIIRSRTEGSPPAETDPTTTSATIAGPAGAPAEPRTRTRRPVVWVQAGHAEPREPGYRAQTGAGSGPFGSEVPFTTELTEKVVALLTRAGVDARPVAGPGGPHGAEGAGVGAHQHDTPR